MNPTPCLPACNSVPVVTNVPGVQGPAGNPGATGPSFMSSTYTAYASGTPAVLTSVMTALVLGSSSPSVTLGAAGTYLIFARARFDGAAVTTASYSTKISIQLYNTNNATGLLANSNRSFVLYNYLSALGTGTVAEMDIPLQVYVTANAGDTIVMQGQLSAGLAQGTVSCAEADIVAVKIA